LSRFDGHSFVNYTVRDGLPHPWVNDLLETRDGVYWVATDDGVCRYNPTGKQRFRVYRPSTRPGAARINGFIEDRTGDIWCATYDGVYRMRTQGDDAQFTREEIGTPRDMLEGSLINSLFLDRRNTLWAAARSGLYRREDGGSWQNYSAPRNGRDDFFETISEDRQGRLWAGTRGRGLCSLIPAPKAGEPVVSRCYSTADGLPSNDVRSIYESSDNRIWIGTAAGLSQLQSGARGPHFRNYTTANGVSGPAIYALRDDREGNLWIGTKENGVMQLSRGGFETYGEAEGYRAGGFSSSIFESEDGELCVTAGDPSAIYLNAFDGARFSATRVNAPLGTDAYREPALLQTRGGEWWATTGAGLFRFPPVRRARELSRLRPQAGFTVKHGLPGNDIHPLFGDSRGDLWFAVWPAGAGTHELYRWERETDRPRRVAMKGAPSKKHKSVNAIAEDRSRELWIGFKEGGLARGRPSSGFAEVSYLTTDHVQALHFDAAGRLWVSSLDSGVTRVDDPTSDQPRFHSYTVANGLSSNQVWCITEDRFGRVYFGTGRGLDRLDPETGSVTHYTASEGLAKGVVKTSYRDRSGALWFATSSEISRLLPVRDPDPAPPVILIRALRVMGAPYPVSELGEARIAGLNLSPGRNGLEIEFLAFDFGPTTRHSYQYKFDGAGYDWSPPSGQRSVNFARLGAGSYRFLVRAVNTDGTPSLQPAAIEFIVMKPVWAQWWFAAAIVLAAGATVCGAFRYRVAQLMKLERVRARISADLHDDIGASLSQIAVLSQVARARLDEAHPVASGPLAEITAISSEVMGSIGDMVWVINPSYDHLNDLAARVRRFAGDLLGARDIALQFNGPRSGENPLLSAEFRRHFLLIAKEAVNNIARHSGATEAHIDFALDTRRLRLRVSDNGRGFDLAACQPGNGLANVRRRAAWLGGTLELRASPGEGTVITVTAPL
jgi:ligand-binding sensor domain-containing protein/signal transduction histidine kinase